MNEMLKEQVLRYFGTSELVPVEWKAFLHEVSNTYNQFESEGASKGKPNEGAEAIKELRIRLKNEAEELEKSNAVLGRILNSVNHGFFSRDIVRDNYNYLSVACERIYGYSAEEFFGNSKLWYELIHPDDRCVVESDNERLENGEEVYTQYRIIYKDKSIRWIELTLIPSFKDNRLVRVDGVVNDITKRKEAETERELMMKELMKSYADLKQFSYITSHNLRSPLSNIQGILSLFDFAETDDYNRQMLEMLKISTQQLGKTIEDLTQILIIKNNLDPNPASLNLEECYNQVIQTFRNALDEIGAKAICDFKSPVVKINKVYLESIFINLISNAIKYRSPKRPLIIKVASIDDGVSNVRVTFSDNGIGIDLARHKEKIFGLYQRFHQNVEGQGLGLFLMKSQIEAAGGKITIESEPDVGTTFTLTLKR